MLEEAELQKSMHSPINHLVYVETKLPTGVRRRASASCWVVVAVTRVFKPFKRYVENGRDKLTIEVTTLMLPGHK